MKRLAHAVATAAATLVMAMGLTIVADTGPASADTWCCH